MTTFSCRVSNRSHSNSGRLAHFFVFACVLKENMLKWRKKGKRDVWWVCVDCRLVNLSKVSMMIFLWKKNELVGISSSSESSSSTFHVGWALRLNFRIWLNVSECLVIFVTWLGTRLKLCIYFWECFLFPDWKKD